MDKLISVVVPMYYEEEVANECYFELTKIMQTLDYNYEIIFVNDGSKDRTNEILFAIAKEDTHVRVFNFSRNFGHQIAVTCGIDNSKGDAVILIDADLQDPPSLINEMVSSWENGADVVYAVRKKRDGETWFKLTTAKMFYNFLEFMTDVAIPKDTGDFRLMDRKVVDALMQMPERSRFIRGMVSWVGFKQQPILYERQKRFAGETKYPFKKMLKFAIDAILSFSSKPLKLIETIGIVSVVISTGVLLYALVCKVLGLYVVDGWTSLIVVITFLGGIQLLSVGIIGEYVARIYDESKNRPLYIVESEFDFSKKAAND